MLKHFEIATLECGICARFRRNRSKCEATFKTNRVLKVDQLPILQWYCVIHRVVSCPIISVYSLPSNLARVFRQLGRDSCPTWRRLPSKLGTTAAQLGKIPFPKLGAFNHQAGRAAFISHMALTIRAMRNNLGTSESPFYALASWSEVVDSEIFIDRMAAGRTTLSKTDIIAVFHLAREKLARLLSEGCYVKTPLGAALLVATGKFSQPRDQFLPKSLASIQCVRDKAWDRHLPNPLAFGYRARG